LQASEPQLSRTAMSSHIQPKNTLSQHSTTIRHRIVALSVGNQLKQTYCPLLRIRPSIRVALPFYHNSRYVCLWLLLTMARSYLAHVHVILLHALYSARCILSCSLLTIP